jgi:hypothetical protein
LRFYFLLEPWAILADLIKDGFEVGKFVKFINWVLTQRDDIEEIDFPLIELNEFIQEFGVGVSNF